MSLLSTTLVATDGAGDVAVSWDFGPVHFFSGVNTIVLLGTAPINLDAVSGLAPLQQATQVFPIFQGGAGAVFEHLPAATQLANALAAMPGAFNALAQQLQPLLGAQLQLASFSSPSEQSTAANPVTVPIVPF